MKTTLGQLAQLVGGRLEGDPDRVAEGAAVLAVAAASDVTFADHPKLRERAEQAEAVAVIVPSDWEPLACPSLHVDDVRSAFAKIVTHFRPEFVSADVGISERAVIDPTAKLAEDVQVHPLAVIGPEVEIGRGSVIHANVVIMGRCKIGQDVVIYPGAVLYRDTIVGDRVIIHANAVLGAYGFGYDTDQGQHHLGAQFGYVEIHDDVELGSATTVDRGSYGPTVIGAGTKIDNQVMVAHNCRLGRHNLICSQVGIAGSSSTGDYVVMAGQVGVPDHVTIGNQAVIGAKSGIMRDVPDGATLLGIPATPERDQMAKQAAIAKLPAMRRQLRDLRRQVERLTATIEQSDAKSSDSEGATHPEAA